MKRLRRTLWGLLIIAVIAAGAWLWWDFDLRGRPHTLAKEQASMAYELERAGWVSPHVNGRIVYVLLSGDCPTCRALGNGPLSTLASKGVDTRVIVVAPADRNGKAMSTPTDRAVVAQLWIDRDYGFYRRWLAPSPSTMAGLRPADGDAARSAVVEASRRSAANIADLLKRNGVRFGYPMAVWWNKVGDMRASRLDNGAAVSKAVREIEAS